LILTLPLRLLSRTNPFNVVNTFVPYCLSVFRRDLPFHLVRILWAGKEVLPSRSFLPQGLALALAAAPASGQGGGPHFVWFKCKKPLIHLTLTFDSSRGQTSNNVFLGHEVKDDSGSQCQTHEGQHLAPIGPVLTLVLHDAQRPGIKCFIVDHH
jgi:hypothetical protein